MPNPIRQSNRIRLIAALLAFACETVAHAQLVCDAPDFDFGVLPETRLEIAHTFTVRNVGAEPADVVAVRSSCDCVTAAPTRRNVPPGESFPVDARFVFKNESGPQRRAIHLAYRASGTAPEIAPGICTFRLTGTILRPVMLQPSRLDLGTIPPGGTATGCVTLAVGRCGPFALQTVASADPGVRADFVPGLRGTNHVVRLLIPSPTHPGPFSGVAVAATDLPETPRVSIAYAGRVEPWLDVRPRVLIVRSERPLDTSLGVVSPFGIPFRVLGTTATDPRLIVTRGDDNRLTVRTVSDVADLDGALVRIATDSPLCPTIEVPVRVSARSDKHDPSRRTP